MNEREKEQLIAHLLRVSQSERDSSLQNDPTFFRILSRTYDEDILSRMLAYVFKHDKNCVWKLISYFRKKRRVFSGEEGCPADFKVESVVCEKSMMGGRADLFVTASGGGTSYTLTIENKIRTGEHDDQTQTYYDFVSRNFRNCQNAFLFLKPRFNGSPVSCGEFEIITYDELLRTMSETEDYRINDFKKHIERYLSMADIKLTETDRQVLMNLSELRNILKATEEKLNSVKQRLYGELYNGAIEGLRYDPKKYKAKKGQERDLYWNEFQKNHSLVVEIADNETSFRIYRADLWYCDKDEEGYYFYVELKFTDNDPGKVVFQEVIKRYGVKPETSIVSRFVKNADFGIDVQNRTCAWEGQWFVLTKKEFDCAHEALSPAWYDELLREAKRTLTEYIKETDTVFSKFTQWRNITL